MEKSENDKISLLPSIGDINDLIVKVTEQSDVLKSHQKLNDHELKLYEEIKLSATKAKLAEK
jgi:hypothetical protein